MTSPVRSVRWLFLLVPATVVLGAPSALATDQNPAEAVYVTDSGEDRIFKVDFAAGTTTAVNTDPPTRGRLTSLAVRDSGLDQVDLLAADLSSDGDDCADDDDDNGVFFYANAQGDGLLITRQVQLPDGLSLDAAKNAYLVNGGPGSSCETLRQVWKIPYTGCSGRDCVGGYPVNGAQLIDKAVPAELLSNTRIVGTGKGPLKVRDLLVLSRKPAQVWLYPGAKPCVELEACTAAERKKLIDNTRFPEGTELTGFVFDPDGNLLILTLAGDVLRYDPAADAFLTNFASDLGFGASRIGLGAQTVDGELKSRAFVTQKNAHQAIAFNIENGLGVRDQTVTENLSAPTGLGLGTSKFRPTPAGAGTKIKLETVEATFDKVRQSGLTDMTCFERPDPRCTNPADPHDCRAVELDAKTLVSSLPHVMIPSYVRGFQKSPAMDAPPAGPAILRICRAATNADIFRTIEQHEDEQEWLLNHPDCNDRDLRGQPRLFWVPAPGEPQIVERSDTDRDKPLMIDLSSACRNTESNRAVTPDYSILLPAVGDTRELNQIVDDKIESLEETLDFLKGSIDGVCKGKKKERKRGKSAVECKLRMALDKAEDAFRGRNVRKTVAALDRFIGIVDANAPEPPAGQCRAGAFDNCSRNVSGELLARAISTRFMVCKIAPETTGCPQP